jgi:hypothetical protein
VRAPILAFAVVGVVLAAACRSRPVEVLQLNGNRLTVVNDSGAEWRNVEVWINRQFRVTTPLLLNNQSYHAALDHFVTGYGQKFNVSKVPINDVRMNAKGPDGTPFEIVKQFSGNPLSDVLKGMGGNR